MDAPDVRRAETVADPGGVQRRLRALPTPAGPEYRPTAQHTVKAHRRRRERRSGRGADPARFAEYDAQVREEYGWVPGLIYKVKRRAVLAGFLARPAIYGTERFRERFEGRARENLREFG